jgi:tRNA U34 5-methylaminomethyl-2-thiouridine-forming methyltransferase MnmC
VENQYCQFAQRQTIDTQKYILQNDDSYYCKNEERQEILMALQQLSLHQYVQNMTDMTCIINV